MKRPVETGIKKKNEKKDNTSVMMQFFKMNGLSVFMSDDGINSVEFYEILFFILITFHFWKIGTIK